MDDTNETDDSRIKAQIDAAIDSGELRLLRGILTISRAVGLSEGMTKQRLEAGTLNPRIKAWQAKSGRWIAIAPRDSCRGSSLDPDQFRQRITKESDGG